MIFFIKTRIKDKIGIHIERLIINVQQKKPLPEFPEAAFKQSEYKRTI